MFEVEAVAIGGQNGTMSDTTRFNHNPETQLHNFSPLYMPDLQQ